MSNLKLKSEDNFKAGVLLTKQEHYAPSIHCYYYSCFQLTKSYLKEYSYPSYEAYDKAYKTYSENPYNSKRGKSNSHVFVVSSMLKLINEAGTKADSTVYHREIKELKALRNVSDYNNETILINDSCKAKSCATTIRELLTRLF